MSPYSSVSDALHGDAFDGAYLAAGRLGEPEGPLVHERVLHVEVLGVVEDSDGITSLALGGDRFIGHDRGNVLSNGSHVESCVEGKSGRRRGVGFYRKRKFAQRKERPGAQKSSQQI